MPPEADPIDGRDGHGGEDTVESPEITRAVFAYYLARQPPAQCRGPTRPHSRRDDMDKRRLGRTGHMSSVVTFGAAGIGRVQQDVADRALALAHGVNHIDVAPRYGDAELRLKPWIPKIRKDVFLGCKTIERTREAAKAELHRSLERLGTDRLDLYQLHSVGKLGDLDACTAKGGALEALVEAREEGLVRWLGITGHTHDAPSTHLEALKR